MKVIGLGDGTYTNKKTGKLMEGYRIYLTGVRQNVVGQTCEEVWCYKDVGDQFLANFPDCDSVLGVEVQVLYPRGGKTPIAIVPVGTYASAKG